ncbi:MAG: hypothetical protein ACW98X_25020 [Promethearchaeota archaeon]|jgi:hypothetical protein
MKYILFKDDRVFNKSKIWDIKEIKHKYPKSEIGEIVTFAKVYIKANNGKTLQTGTIIKGDEEEALYTYLNLKEYNG